MAAGENKAGVLDDASKNPTTGNEEEKMRMIGIWIPSELHRTLRIYCAQAGTPMLAVGEAVLRWLGEKGPASGKHSSESSLLDATILMTDNTPALKAGIAIERAGNDVDDGKTKSTYNREAGLHKINIFITSKLHRHLRVYCAAREISMQVMGATLLGWLGEKGPASGKHSSEASLFGATVRMKDHSPPPK